MVLRHSSTVLTAVILAIFLHHVIQTGSQSTVETQQSSCGLPVVNGRVCTSVCGSQGGYCVNCTCFCGNLNTVYGPRTTFESNCTVSTDEAKNTACQCTCEQAYPEYATLGYSLRGQSCNLTGLVGVGNLTDTCVCNLRNATTPPRNLSDEICSLGIGRARDSYDASSSRCARVCRYGGQCIGYMNNTCACNCPTRFRNPNADEWNAADAHESNRCPHYQRINDSAQLQICKASCPPGSKYVDVCSPAPKYLEIIFLTLNAIVDDYFCSCTPNCDGPPTCNNPNSLCNT